MKRKNSEVEGVMRWFETEVTYDGEPYVIDAEQAMAVVNDAMNTVVVARAGSGKTRTLVAKVVYLVAKCGVLPQEILAFVFNANAAREINERLSRMRVGGEIIIPDARIAVTFHAFSRRIVYKMNGDARKIGEILADEKERFVREVVDEMAKEEKWRKMIGLFIGGVGGGLTLSEEEIGGFSKLMTTFINRAQQKYLGGELTLGEVAKEYLIDRGGSSWLDFEELDPGAIDEKTWAPIREGLFVKLGVECSRRYHQILLDEEARRKVSENCGGGWIQEYGTDFNLIVSWASKIIRGGSKQIVDFLGGVKYLLIDEYQDFSQLFLAVVLAIRGVAEEAKLFVVGDDWQAINRFAGSDVEFFRNFEKYLACVGGDSGCARCEITTNYRCDRVIVESARRFMQKSMKEKGNFKAFSKKSGKVTVVNPRETEVGYALVPYDLRISAEDRILREATERMGCAVVKKSMVRYLKTVLMIVAQNLEAKDILILHRNNETNIGGASLAGFYEGLKWGLDRLGVMRAEVFEEKVKLMTMHKSKGLEADVVIILEADEGVIPKLHPDTMLYGLFGETNEVALDDQKRLFYVAMTRAKHRLYIISEGGGFMKYLGRGVMS